MAKTHGKNAGFKIDVTAGGAVTDISNSVDNVDFPFAKELSDVSSFGDSGHEFLAGLQNTRFTVSGFFDSAASNVDSIFGAMHSDTVTRTFEYGPEGITSGKVKYSGECWLVSYNPVAVVGDAVKFTAELQVDGVVTRGTFA